MQQSTDYTQLVSIIISSGIVTAVVNFILNRAKSAQELEKLKQDTGLQHITSLGEVISILRGEIKFHQEQLGIERTERFKNEEKLRVVEQQLKDCLDNTLSRN